MASEWHLWIDPVRRPGWANMAIDQSLLDRADAAGERWLRLYRWSPHCLSFGRHEPATRRYDPARIAELHLDLVRRPTGGRAVWHAEEVTYSVALPSAGLGGIREACLEIHRMLLDALLHLGVPAGLAPAARPASLDAGACFAQASGGEIVVSGRKVVGSAQLRQGNALLQHGSILIDGGQELVAAVSRGARTPEPGLLHRPLLLKPPAAEAVVDAVARAARARWGGTWRRRHVARALLHDSDRHAARFRSREWTWRV